MSLFFCLPRELRDQIYEYALDTAPKTFKYDGLTLLATAGFPNTAEVDTNGLSPWIRTNKQMCAEAIEVFGRLRTFMAIEYEGRNLRFDHWPRRQRAILNPLVINQIVIKNITVARGFSQLPGGSRATGVLLRLLRSWQSNDLCLETKWMRQPLDPGWKNNGESDVFEEWNSFWNGRFRSVKIYIHYVTSTRNAAKQKMLELAEACARRLVGGDQGAVKKHLGTYDQSEIQYQKQCVTVERKI
ncbi:uncharacterized protein K460DRAFT_399878 [Cucurbitaria berberidis CBS 394.84]|uniref:Uncharacterized protein n=1 Tax=Cucurbitaria berberidis CBS 394.84 TaxID=1168544 RepID=A0A9P4GQY8_9PLEO|nr:uncharacterized protein K460DRAFT_399878 [Cucurbitaria berberidis CBS 394.84]KAF1849766.1 hypothetical protein K460DRAFT_399878 [Cucurbitaria berberidis CBS 394.84]